jgi:DNA invertase Pin-like site-specific DNA recombinase
VKRVSVSRADDSGPVKAFVHRQETPPVKASVRGRQKQPQVSGAAQTKLHGYASSTSRLRRFRKIRHEEMQCDLLDVAGCEGVYVHHYDSDVPAFLAEHNRRRFIEYLDNLHKGDTLVVTQLDRLAHSLPDLVTILRALQQRGIGFRSLEENIDLAPDDQRSFELIAAIADFNRRVISKATREGMNRARARGVKTGPSHKLGPKEIEYARKLIFDEGQQRGVVAKKLKVTRATLWRALATAPTAQPH